MGDIANMMYDNWVIGLCYENDGYSEIPCTNVEVIKVLRETSKAWYLRLIVDCDLRKQKDMWLPKLQCVLYTDEQAIAIPDWLYDKNNIK